MASPHGGFHYWANRLWSPIPLPRKPHLFSSILAYLLTQCFGRKQYLLDQHCLLRCLNKKLPVQSPSRRGVIDELPRTKCKDLHRYCRRFFFSSSPTTRAKAYLLLNSILPLVGCVIASPFVRDVSVGITKRVEGGFIVMFVITITTGIYAVISSLGSISSKLSPVNNLIGMGVFLLAPLVVPLSEKIRDVLNKKGLIYREKRVCDFTIEEFDDGVERVLENGVKEGEDIGEEVREGAVMEETGVKLMVRRVEFWLYFFVYIFGATIGLVYLNNLGQIAESRGYSRTSSLVSLSSSFGFFGRLMPSLLDYCFSR